MEEHRSGAIEFIRKLLPWTSAALVIAVLYVGWTFYSRWHEARELQESRAEKAREDAKKTVEAYGGNKLTILHFYATPGVVSRGATTQLCYGVSNAKQVEIEPKVEGVWPSMSRCIDVPVRQTTTFTLKASDAEGHTETQPITVTVP